MKKHKKLWISLVFVVLLVVSFLMGVNFNKEETYSEDDTSKSKQVVRESTLSMMIEQTAGAGDYKMETRTSWPTDGYTFNATLSKCENGGELGWDSEKGVVTMTGNMSDKCYIYFDIYNPPTLAEYIKGLYTTQGAKGLYYHDGSLENGIDDGSYRYAGPSVNNYVCFGSTEATCPTDNLYRIIGVFNNQVKLIKSTAASSALLGTDGDYSHSSTYYYWNYNANSSATNTWSTSLLNKTNLNTNYINNIGSTWSAKIATTTWKVGGNTYANIGSVVPATAYANEITSPAKSTTIDAKIGLMYVSDFGFAADPSAWSTVLESYDSYKSVNWMAFGSSGWTISPRDISGFIVLSSGDVTIYLGNDERGGTYNVWPVFYLTSSITYVSGTGTSTDPFRIN